MAYQTTGFRLNVRAGRPGMWNQNRSSYVNEFLIHLALLNNTQKEVHLALLNKGVFRITL